MNPTRNAGRTSPKTAQGATLIELLAVILILLMITAMTIPAVTPAMAGRRVREGARMFSTFLNAARNRAIETGRPAGVLLERKAGLAEISDHIYMAEIPPVYGGDFVDSSVECSLVDEDGQLWRDENGRNKRDFWNLVVPRTRTAFGTDVWSNPDVSEQQLVREGDLIQFEGQDRLYPLKTVDLKLQFGGKQTKWWYILRGRNCAGSTGPSGAYTNECNHSGNWIIRWFERTRHVDHHTVTTIHYDAMTNYPINPGRAGIRYKIYRQPTRLQAGSIRMPETVVVDLNYSSMTNGTTSDPGIPFHPRVEPAQKVSGTTLRNPMWGHPVHPDDETPVVIVFSAGGQVERVYCHRRDTVGNWSWEATEAYGPIYLMVGDRQHVTPDAYLLSQSADENMRVQFKKNWLNLDALWVRISPNTGLTTVSLIDDFAYISGTTLLAADPSELYRTRAKARADRLHGGR